MKSIDQQLLNQPQEVKFCVRCVVSNQRPRNLFNQEGICNACLYAEQKYRHTDWEKREQELIELLNRHRSKDGSFDCIVPSSGGKDSSLVAHQLRYKYGMHPLTITWAPFIYTDIGWKNYYGLVQSGLDNWLFYPNGKSHRKLARVAFELKGDHWEPFTFGQKAYAFQVAIKMNIPLVFYGENAEIEYGGSMKNAFKSHESPADWEELYYKGGGIEKLLAAGRDMGILTKEEANPKNFEFYLTPPLDVIAKHNIQGHWWSYYHKWIPQENYYYAAKHTGFEANPDGRSEGTYSKYASLDDQTDGFHYYLAYIKFGICRATSDAAHEIRDGHITREEGAALVRRYDGEFPKKYFKEFLEYLDIDEKHFWQVVDSYRPDHLWKKINGEWKLRHTVWGGGTDD